MPIASDLFVSTAVAVLASIPSPSFDSFEIGPLTLRMYGLCIALGVIAAVIIATRRWENRGGSPDDISTLALWCVPAGVIGTRIYHVATDWKSYQDNWADAFNITQGGLGIPGGIAAGVLVGWFVARRHGWPMRDLFDSVAPAIPVAQAIGRLGNWFNQELFGGPTDLPWGLRIDEVNRPAEFFDHETFHPTFLYEGLWNLALAGIIVVLGRRAIMRRGELFLVYMAGYGVGRFWVEALRSDEASLILGVRVNHWMSLGLIVSAALLFWWGRRRGGPVNDPDAPAPILDPEHLSEQVDQALAIGVTGEADEETLGSRERDESDAEAGGQPRPEEDPARSD